MLTLTRRWQTNLHPSSTQEDLDGQRHELAVGHPPIPVEALPVLRTKVMGQHYRGHEPTRWYHRSGNAWATVVDLHQASEHDAATALARLLDWCDQHGSHDDHTLWEITEGGAA